MILVSDLFHQPLGAWNEFISIEICLVTFVFLWNPILFFSLHFITTLFLTNLRVVAWNEFIFIEFVLITFVFMEPQRFFFYFSLLQPCCIILACSGPLTSTDCRLGEFQCADKRCVPEYLRCDGTPDCSDGGDERNCRKYFFSPKCVVFVL